MGSVYVSAISPRTSLWTDFRSFFLWIYPESGPPSHLSLILAPTHATGFVC